LKLFIFEKIWYLSKCEVRGGLGLQERGGRSSITYLAMKPPEVEREIRTSSLDMPMEWYFVTKIVLMYCEKKIF
jgi:hypothetical protein